MSNILPFVYIKIIDIEYLHKVTLQMYLIDFLLNRLSDMWASQSSRRNSVHLNLFYAQKEQK